MMDIHYPIDTSRGEFPGGNHTPSPDENRGEPTGGDFEPGGSSRIPHFRQVLKTLRSGQITLESGDELVLRFECHCNDARQFCKSACCSLQGISITDDEKKTLEGLMSDLLEAAGDNFASPVALDTFPDSSPIAVRSDSSEKWCLRRLSDGYCVFLDRQTRFCRIYHHRPATCKVFHCSLGPGCRGWRLEFSRT